MTIEEIREKVAHIEGNLSTRAKWTKADYADFYERDVTFLLEAASRIDQLAALVEGAYGEGMQDAKGYGGELARFECWTASDSKSALERVLGGDA